MDFKNGIDKFKKIISGIKPDEYIVHYIDLDNINVTYKVKDINIEIDKNNNELKIFDSCNLNMKINIDHINNYEIDKDNSSELTDYNDLTLYMLRKCCIIRSVEIKY